MSNTDADVGGYKITVASAESPSAEYQRERAEALTRWLLATFNRQRKEACDAEAQSAG